MKMTCENCGNTYNNEVELYINIEDCNITKVFGIEKAKKLLNRGNFYRIDETNLIKCGDCGYIFNYFNTVKKL